MAAPNFELVTELQTLIRRDFPLADPTLLSPSGATALIDGEWLELVAYKLARGAANPDTSSLAFPLHSEKGRYDTQAIGKATVLYLGQYEADTKVFEGTPAVGTLLTVQNGATDLGGGVYRRILKAKTGAASTVVGIVTKTAASNGGKLRFVHFGNIYYAA